MAGVGDVSVTVNMTRKDRELILAELLGDLSDCFEAGVGMDFGERPTDVPLRWISQSLQRHSDAHRLAAESEPE